MVAHGADAHDAAVDAPEPPVPGAKIWLQMETDPNVAIIDSAGGHACSCGQTGCPSRAAGKHGEGYKVTGQVVLVQDAADLDPSAGFTAAAWARVETYPASNLDGIFAKPFSASGDTFVLGVVPGGASVFDSEDPSNVTDTFDGPVLDVGVWHHVAFVWTGSAKLGYFDGVFVAASNVTVGVASGPFYIGGDDNPPSFLLTGTVDDVLYYTRALSANEIALLAAP